MESPQQVIDSFYTCVYRTEKHDSPEESRVSLTRRIVTTLKSGITEPQILDIGSGPQSLEKQLLSGRPQSDINFFKKFMFVTLDVVEIYKKKLLAKRASHVRADALKLPFKSESFGLVVSNHAIDFLPRAAFLEAHRVLAPGGKAIFYFHHPDMIPDDLSSVRNRMIRQFWQYLKNENVLFKSEEEITQTLQGAGFTLEEIIINSDSQDKWWEVFASK